MSISTRLCILSGSSPSTSALAEGHVFGGYDRYLLESSLARAGFDPSQVTYKTISDDMAYTINELNAGSFDLILALGEKALAFLTGHKGIDKWHLSPLDTTPAFTCRKTIPTFDFRRLNIQYEMRFFFQKAILRASESMYPGPWKRKKTNFILVDQVYELENLRDLDLASKGPLSVDIETSRGTINTLGFAWSESDAVAIRCSPGYYDEKTQFSFWCWARNLLEDKRIPKILQNNIYEATYFARYGIVMPNVWHDTMWAQKLMYPEFSQDLATIGRLYTNEVYWKEDNKDWNRIDSWERHLTYNCKDTTGTYEAMVNQRKELKERNLLELYENYLIRLAAPLSEMCTTGLIVDEEKRAKTSQDIKDMVNNLASTLSEKINHRSWQHKKKLLEGKGYKLPTKKNSKGIRTGSTDELSLKKLRAKHPQDTDITTLLKLAKLEKFRGSYVNFDYHDDGIVRYTIRGTGTETLRFAGNLDSWGMGFNPQTIPKKAKAFFLPPKNHYFMQVDLSQAESRYVAYRAKEWKLIEMLEDPKQDVHSYVASNIFGVPVEQVIKEKNAGQIEKRQLGKKSGHGGNYAMQAKTFMDNCFKEDLVLSIKEAENALEGYHRAFPMIRPWHRELRDTIKSKGYLETPLGFRRYFYGRHNDTTFREAYAFEPQSTIPMITNHMLLYLLKQRDFGVFDFNIHLQVHDSLVLSCTEKHLENIMQACLNYKLWHPKVTFPVTGEMWIPTECEYSNTNLAEMIEYKK